ncbi:diacylglycerol lipase-beta [Apis cerana]|uniref:sn-1-specific diacylglycerol lipase n=1 Tax=Apis cerana cerana TaxID=94128 RepID=A0A2A3E001_APICC|nr:diacylglycerol lipase-beta [Apis cerana]PBC25090.1 Sn1-specific diacylglycerol lipase beta [Apis cerana cerana]
MPAIKLFGRKWLTATDDCVYPGLFEVFIRIAWLIPIIITCIKYYEYTWNCQSGGVLVRVYLLGEGSFLIISILLLLIIIKLSSRGSIMETQARKYVEPFLAIKILLILPEIGWNILGTLWMYGSSIKCSYEHYTMSVVQTLVFFDWVLIGLTIGGLALIFDPIGSLNKRYLENSMEHAKISKTWLRRLKYCWWIKNDESAKDTLQYAAALLCALSRGTDLIPSDVIAGLILLRVQEKRERHELRRINLHPTPVRTSDAAVIFKNMPKWMSLENAVHYMMLSEAIYGWLFMLYLHKCSGCFYLMKNLTCCGCFRRKRIPIKGDNCCYCYLTGVKYLSKLSTDDILFASFKNNLCEIPFFVIVDEKTNKIVIILRGSLSLRDVITDITADSAIFECEGVPPGAQAHRGMIQGAKLILRQLDNHKVLERAFNMYPHYDLLITGHSLGAGIGTLLGFLLRQRYPSLKVYAFATPAGLVSRELARISEEFIFTIGIGDDFVMRLSVDSIENLRTRLLMVLRACRLPKYRVVLNGLGYVLFGIPEKDLEKMWKPNSVIKTISGESPLLNDRNINRLEENRIYEPDFTKRRFSQVRLYTSGKILHITERNVDKSDGKKKKLKIKEKTFEMRWAQPEEFTELIVMPRMLLDHLPENVGKVLNRLAEQQKNLSQNIDL